MGAWNWCAAVVDGTLLVAVRELAGRSWCIVLVCVGAFLLVIVGLFDGCCAVIYWELVGELACEFLVVEVDVDALFVVDGLIHFLVGIMVGIDLCLVLVEVDHGVELVCEVVCYFVVFMQRLGG